jgi:DNA-binding MarR family transcriptional regulator
MNSQAIHQIRSFNRIVAERIGAVDDKFLRRPRPYGETRLLWEIGGEGADVRALRRRLSIDSGYLSRVLRSLEGQGLITVRTSKNDARVRCASLTAAGRRERAEVDRRSDALAAGILDPLTSPQRETLVSAMREVERLLQASMVAFAVEDPASADAQWCAKQYFDELAVRFEGGYDPGGDPIEIAELTPPNGALMIARLRGRPVGCGALRFKGAKPGRNQTAYFKRIWISSDVRGLGVGRRLLTAMEREVERRKIPLIRLDTNRVLNEAIAMYRRYGYSEIERFNDNPYAHHWFEKKL